LQKLKGTVSGEAGEVAQELPVVPEVNPEHFGDGEDILTVRDREENLTEDELSKEEDLFLVTGGTEVSALTGKGNQKFFATRWATCFGEAPGQVAAVDELVDYVFNDRSKVSVCSLIRLNVLDEVVEVIMETLPER